MREFPRLLLLVVASLPALACAQSVIVEPTVTDAYGRVMRVEPVYQTVRAVRAEQQCEPVVRTVTPAPAPGMLDRVIGSVRSLIEPLTGGARPDVRPVALEAANCRTVQVPREFQRPIAYDVDYTYKGDSYRVRLPEDPGSRIKLRVTVVPVVAGKQP